MTRTEGDLVAELERTRDETLQYFALGESELAKTYAPGKWPVGFLVRHLADSEQVLYERICRTIAEQPRPALAYFQESEWATKMDYADTPLAIARGIYESVRRAHIHHAAKFYESHGHLEFMHSTAGLRTLKDEFDKVADNNEHHMTQIRQELKS